MRRIENKRIITSLLEFVMIYDNFNNDADKKSQQYSSLLPHTPNDASHLYAVNENLTSFLSKLQAFLCPQKAHTV